MRMGKKELMERIGQAQNFYAYALREEDFCYATDDAVIFAVPAIIKGTERIAIIVTTMGKWNVGSIGKDDANPDFRITSGSFFAEEALWIEKKMQFIQKAFSQNMIQKGKKREQQQ